MTRDATSHTRGFHTGAVLTFTGAHAVHDTFSSFLPPLFPELMRRFLIDRTEVGLLSIFLQAPSLLQPLLGHLGDRRDLRWLVALTPAITAAAMSCLPLAPGYLAAALLLTAAGLSSAALHSLAPPLAGRLSGASLGRGMGFWMVGGELGRTIGPVLIVSVIEIAGLRSTPWLMTAGVAASVLLLSHARSWPRPEAAGPSRTAGISRGIRRLSPLFGPLAGLILARSFLMAAATTYLPLFLHEQGSSLWISGAALSILEAAGIAGALAGGTISDRLGRRRVLAGSLAASSLLLFGLTLIPGWPRAMILPFLGFSALAVGPVVMAAVQEVDVAHRALANGLYMAMSFTLRSVIIVATGAIGDHFGLGTAYLVCAAAGLAGIPFALHLPRAGQPAAKPNRGSGVS